MPYPEVLLMRHGETEWNRARRMQGRLNSALTETGQHQARTLGALVAGRAGGWPIWCSPQGRAVQTAALAFGGGTQPIRTDDRLSEIDIGAWSGQLHSDLSAAHPELFDPADRLRWYDAAPGGEGFAGLQARCAAFLRDMSGPAVIISHGITIRMLRSLALSGSDVRLRDAPGIGQGVAYHVRAGQLTVVETAAQMPA